MSGHSHWATIKHKKGAADAKKGKMFSKIAKDLMQAAKEGGGDPKMNGKLALAMEKAKGCNMPKENVERAIKKGTGELQGEAYAEITYEGYGPGGVAIIVDTLTDNKNRTVPELRKMFESKGGSLGATNSVAWIFERKGVIVLPTSAISEDDLMGVALDAGAENIETEGESFIVTTAPEDLDKVKAALEAKKLPLQSAETSRVAKNYVKVQETEEKKVLELIEALDSHDDVQQVHFNLEPSGSAE